MGRRWNEENELHLEDYMRSPQEWEVMHEEEGYEGKEEEPADLDEAELHIHLHLTSDL